MKVTFASVRRVNETDLQALATMVPWLESQKLPALAGAVERAHAALSAVMGIPMSAPDTANEDDPA